MKPAIIIGVIIIILIIGIGVIQKAPQASKTQVAPSSDTTSNSQPTQNESLPNNLSDQKHYVEYNPSQLNTYANTRRVLFFYAKWCSTCRPADANFMENKSRIPEDVTLIRVNYNDDDTDQSEKDLAKKYGVTYQHTFVQIDSSGNEITRWVGGDIEELLSSLK